MGVLLAIFLLISCEQSESNNFTLEGDIDGSNIEYLVLQYINNSDLIKADTIRIKNKKFSTKGSLKHPQKVSLTSNLSAKFMDELNSLTFFLEPKKIHLNLKEDKFYEARISGSKTQIEKEKLDKITDPIYTKIEIVRNKRKELTNKHNATENEYLKDEILELDSEWKLLLNEIKNVRIQYVTENIDSYLSADILNFYKRKLTLDSLGLLYYNLNSQIQESSYGKTIKEKLAMVKSGDSAPVFSGQDIDGRDLNLSDFSGKIVLLDFGAAWCIPCVENHPKLKELYTEFQHKGFEVISISFDKDRLHWRKSVQSEKLNWHHIYEGFKNVDKSGSISKMYYVKPIPAYILIDDKGIIIDRYSGADSNNKNFLDLEIKIRALFSHIK